MLQTIDFAELRNGLDDTLLYHYGNIYIEAIHLKGVFKDFITGPDMEQNEHGLTDSTLYLVPTPRFFFGWKTSKNFLRVCTGHAQSCILEQHSNRECFLCWLHCKMFVGCSLRCKLIEISADTFKHLLSSYIGKFFTASSFHALWWAATILSSSPYSPWKVIYIP